MNSTKLKMVSNQILELFFFASFKVLAVESISSSNLETQAVLLIFSLELEISGVAVLHQKAKMVAFVRNYLVKMTLRLFQPLSVVLTMVPTLPRQFRRSLQIKKSITNAPVCYNLLNNIYTYPLITVKKGWLLGHV